MHKIAQVKDPEQKHLRDKKKLFNKEYKSWREDFLKFKESNKELNDKFRAFKNALNGYGDDQFSLPEKRITEPMGEIAEFLSSLTSDYEKVVQNFSHYTGIYQKLSTEAKDILDNQTRYSEKFKENKKAGAIFEFEKTASSAPVRLITRILAPFLWKTPYGEQRKEMLSRADILWKTLLGLQDLLLSGEPSKTFLASQNKHVVNQFVNFANQVKFDALRVDQLISALKTTHKEILDKQAELTPEQITESKEDSAIVKIVSDCKELSNLPSSFAGYDSKTSAFLSKILGIVVHLRKYEDQEGELEEREILIRKLYVEYNSKIKEYKSALSKLQLNDSWRNLVNDPEFTFEKASALHKASGSFSSDLIEEPKTQEHEQILNIIQDIQYLIKIQNILVENTGSAVIGGLDLNGEKFLNEIISLKSKYLREKDLKSKDSLLESIGSRYLKIKKDFTGAIENANEKSHAFEEASSMIEDVNSFTFREFYKFLHGWVAAQTLLEKDSSSYLITINELKSEVGKFNDLPTYDQNAFLAQGYVKNLVKDFTDKADLLIDADGTLKQDSRQNIEASINRLKASVGSYKNIYIKVLSEIVDESCEQEIEALKANSSKLTVEDLVNKYKEYFQAGKILDFSSASPDNNPASDPFDKQAYNKLTRPLKYYSTWFSIDQTMPNRRKAFDTIKQMKEPLKDLINSLEKTVDVEFLTTKLSELVSFKKELDFVITKIVLDADIKNLENYHGADKATKLRERLELMDLMRGRKSRKSNYFGIMNSDE